MSEHKETRPDPFARFREEAAGDETPVDVPMDKRNGDPLLRKDGERVVLKVVGEFSKRFKDADRKFNDKVIRSARRGIELADEGARLEAERMAAAVVGWNLDDANGADIPFTGQNVAQFLLAAEWNAPKVKRAIKAPDSFFLPESTS